MMFRVDSKVGAEILNIAPEAYRKRLSRIRQKMAAFLGEYCALGGSEKCDCKKRVGYAIQNHRLDSNDLEYARLERVDDVTRAMEEFDEQAAVFADLPKYRSPETVRGFLDRILRSGNMAVVQQTYVGGNT